MIRAIGRNFARLWADQSGAAGLILAAAIMTIGFTALAIFLKGSQSRHALEQAKGAVSGEARLTNAILAYYLADPDGAGAQTAPLVLPCPDTAIPPTGDQASSCTAAGNYAGAIPWKTLGLSKSDAVDAYGNFYTYIVSGEANGLCESITKATLYGGGKEFTGRLITSNLEAKSTDQSAGGGQKVPFVIIGHGKNGLGALGNGGAFTAAPASSIESVNKANATASTYATFTTVNTGPARIGNDLSASTYFDDQVIVPSTTVLQKACGALTPGNSVNASISDSFNNNTTSNNNFGNMATSGTGTDGVTITTSADNSGNKVAQFTATGTATSYLVTNSTTFDFTPTVRPIYVSTKWRASTGRFSIGTRGRTADVVAGHDYLDTGVTFRFNQDSSNSIVILRNGTAQTITLTVSGGLSITANRNYKLEVYDDGSNVWARITDILLPTQYATAYAPSITSTTNYGQVFFINGSVASEIDDVLAGFPMLAMETTGTSSYASAAGATSNGVSTGKITLEAWVRPRAFPSANATIMGKWNTAAADSDASQGYRLRIDSGGVVNFDAAVVNGGVASQKHYAGPSLTLNEWAHIAVTFTYADTAGVGATDTDTETVTFFKNGDQYSTAVNTFASTASTQPSGLTNTATGTPPVFVVGSETTSGSVNAAGFNGDISDVRVWNEARSAQNIATYFQTRLSALASDTGSGLPLEHLVVNWRLDSESIVTGTGLATTTALTTPSTVGVGGTLTANALYIPTLAQYFRPLSTSTGFCPSTAIAGAYQCDFRVTSAAAGAQGLSTTVVVPSNLLAISGKVWGAGGGAYDITGTTRDNVGASGGFSGGVIKYINGAANTVPGKTLRIYVGGFGSGSTSTLLGAGGGAGSGIFDDTYHPGLVAGGGGGSAWSEKNVSGGGNDCSSVASVTDQCGLGGQGGGENTGNTLTTGPSENSNCAGRGGDSVAVSGPPQGDCGDGGGPATTPTNALRAQGGGGGTAGMPGGIPAFMAGGYGYQATTEGNDATPDANGTGGGGGGYQGGEAGGFEDNDPHNGFGGGGGSGYADAGVTNALGAAGSYSGAFDENGVHSGTTHHNDSPYADTEVTDIMPKLKTGDLLGGDVYSISATPNRIPNNTTITLVCITGSETGCTYANSLVISNGATGSATNVVSLHISSTLTAATSAAGNASDYYYSPSYLDSTLVYPGKGGLAGSADGHAGAVVLIW